MEKEKPLKELLDSVREIDGFPIGDDEDILELSDPPYYTACPNPYINDFIEQHGTPYDPENDNYDKEPYVGDVSEGKNDPVYNAHSYHTKVPYKAIKKFIEHYTKKGDIVFDGFCGSGMTGIAAQTLNRNVILSELSSAAAFISYNYNNKIKRMDFRKKVSILINEVKSECGWMYKTEHVDNGNGKINYTIWSEVLICPYCECEYSFWEAAVNKQKGAVKDNYKCPKCFATINKRDSKRSWVTFYDSTIDKEVKQVKQKPVLINYTYKKERFEKKPDQKDFELIKKIRNSEIPYWYPTNKIPKGDKTPEAIKMGITNIHHYYTKRNLWILSSLWDKAKKLKKNNNLMKFLISSYNMSHSTFMTRIIFKKNNSKPVLTSCQTGTIYISSLPVEKNIINGIKSKIRTMTKMLDKHYNNYIISNQSLTDLDNIRPNSIDYIFTDPPFGANLMYSELNFIWESWLKVFTNNKEEAVISKFQNKNLDDYKNLIQLCFKKMLKILKPNRWMTVVFHNSKSSVWNAIQEAITKSGFIIGQVAVLDKKQGSFNQVVSPGSVKNDLVINAYKPSNSFTKNFIKNAGNQMELELTQNRLTHLPVEPNIERTEKMLFSRMLAFYMQKGYQINYDSKHFYLMLEDNFVSEDGYWFLPEQIDDYREYKKKMKLDEIEDIQSGQSVMFVKDEESAVTWLHQFLDEPQTFQEIFPSYTKILQQSRYDETPELKDMLELYFIKEDGKYRRPKTKEEKISIHERKEKVLNREFEEILMEAKNSRTKIKKLRKEALLYGFKKCYQNEEFQKILTIADRLYKSTLNNNPNIKEYVDIAKMKIEGF